MPRVRRESNLKPGSGQVSRMGHLNRDLRKEGRAMPTSARKGSAEGTVRAKSLW